MKRLMLIVLCFSPCLCVAATISAFAPVSDPKAASELRYVLKIDTPYFFDIRATRGKNRLKDRHSNGDIEIEAVAEKVKTYVVETSMLEREEVFSTLLLEFAPDGQLRSHIKWPSNLFARELEGGALKLVGAEEGGAVFRLGRWIRTPSSNRSPALCTEEDSARYQPGARPTAVRGNFGCREWSYYLHSNKIPYIDITSYQYSEDAEARADERGRASMKVVALIKPMLGWGSYGVPVKPVIGKHGDSWFCLHDCPDGDLPGYIPNIKTWLKRHHWPMPRVPKSMPLFVD